MWEPQPSWQPVRGGPSTGGVWRAEVDGRSWVVKRLDRPGDDDPAHVHDPGHPAYWRREADVAADPGPLDGPGLVPPTYGAVEEDADGVTVWSQEVLGEPPTGLQVAACLGRFAASPYAAAPWAARQQLRSRLAMTEQRGGWRTLSRTTLADVTEHLWQRRGHWCDRLEAAPQGRVHGDAVPSNVLAARGDDVVATDWQCSGVGAVGADLGYWALSSREGFEVLLDAFLEAAVDVDPGLDVDAVTTSAQVVAVFSVLNRAEWALAQAAAGEGALAGKFRHPAVAPYLRAVQRQLPQAEVLLG